MNFPDEVKDMMIDASKQAIEHLEKHKDKLTVDELIDLEKLKFAITLHQLEKQKKEGRS